MIVAQTGLPASLNGQSVAAWKASRFPPSAKFPPTGSNIPNAPDVTSAVAAGAFSMTTTADEDYWVATYAGDQKISYHWFFRYQPPSYITRQDYTGPGAPPAAFKPPDGSTWTTNQSASAGSRLWICWGGVWTATAA
jgi:hypothetical protein